MTGQRVPSSWLADLRAAEEAATPGPWGTREWTLGLTITANGNCLLNSDDYGAVPVVDDEADARLIAAARNALPQLLAAAEAIERVREIHRPESDGTGRRVCSSCLAYTSPMPARIDWPCRTVRALEGATDAD